MDGGSRTGLDLAMKCPLKPADEVHFKPGSVADNLCIHYKAQLAFRQARLDVSWRSYGGLGRAPGNQKRLHTAASASDTASNVCPSSCESWRAKTGLDTTRVMSLAIFLFTNSRVSATYRGVINIFCFGMALSGPCNSCISYYISSYLILSDYGTCLI